MAFLNILISALLLQTGSINGVVTKAGTNEQLPKAAVELRTADVGDAVLDVTVSKDDGTFAFRNVKPGKYRLAASRTGYVKTEYGQRKVKGRGVPIEMTRDQNPAGVRIALIPSGAIYGRIYDATGQPVVKTEVQALRPAYRDGRRILTPVLSVLANDLGEYRLFGLAPGQYFIGAVAPNWNRLGDSTTLNVGVSSPGSAVMSMRFSGSPDDPLSPTRAPSGADSSRYQTVYFPNTTDDQAAQSIELKPGASLGGMDILLAPARTRTVRGIVMDTDTGKPATVASRGFPVQIVTLPSTNGASNGLPDANTGTFQMQVLQTPTALNALADLKTGRITLPFGDTDISDLRITVSSGFTIPGRITVDGNPPPTGLRVSLSADPLTLVRAAPDSGMVANDGTFSIQNVHAGDFRVNVAPILSFTTSSVPPSIPSALQNAYVKSIGFGDADALDSLLHVEGAAKDALTIAIVTDAASLTGTALDDKQQPVADATVVLVPMNRARTDLFRFAGSDASGAFKLDRIPPGDYKVFAWDEIENGAWLDPQFMRSFDEGGNAIRIQARDKKEIRISVIPSR